MAEERNLSVEIANQLSFDQDSLRTLIDLLPAGVIVCDAQGTITRYNPAAAAILGTPVTGNVLSPSGRYTLHRLDGSLVPPDAQPLYRALQRGEVTRDQEFLVRDSNGAETLILVAASPICDPTGRISGGVAVFQDVTERARTMNLLRARGRQQGAIATLGQEALVGTDLARLFDDAVRLVADTLDVEYAKVLEVLPGRTDLLLRAGVGWTEGLVGHATVEGGAGSQAGYTLQSTQPVIVADLPSETRFHGPALLREHGVVSGVSVIIAGHPRPFGVLGAHTRRGRQFTTDDVNFVQSIANVLALAIERTRTEDALRLQAQIINQVHDSVISTDLQGRVTSWNKGAEEIFGYTASEALGQHISFVYPASAYPEGARAFLDRQVIAPLLAQGHHQIEVTMQRESGEQFNADLRLSVLRNQAGQVTGLIGYSMDITARLRAEVELRRTEEHLRAVTSNAPIILFALDAKGVFTLSTGRGLEALGLKPGEVVGRSLFDVYRDESSTLEHARRALAGESFTAIDTVAPGLVWETRWSALRDSGGNTTGVVGVATNITERYYADQARERFLVREQAIAGIAQALVRERELAKVIDVVITQSQQVLHADIVGVWLANPVRRDLALVSSRGASPETIELLHQLPFDAPALTARAAQTGRLQRLENLSDGTEGLPITRQTAKNELMRSVLALPLNSGGHLVGVVTYLWRKPRRFTEEELAFDMTVADLFAVAIENANLYDRVSQALEVREEFMAAAAHELRTPLTVIKGRAQMALRAGVPDERLRQTMDSIDRYVNRITRIVNDLLLAVRVRPGLTALHLTDLDLSALVAETTAQIARRNGGVSLQVQPDGPLVVRGDRGLLEEVITRLIENALSYSLAPHRVEVRAERQDGEAVVSVTDHGVGIPVARQPHVFEPFYELVPSGEPGYTGIVNLGLYLSKQIVEAHGGRIWFVSTPGSGSTFSFSLPIGTLSVTG